MESNPTAARFPTTRWSRVARAGGPTTPEAHAALAELCAAYWYPIYALIRRKGHGPEEALDLTQGYFARLLERGNVAAAAAGKGRFRSFLRADCARFLADCREHERAAKRGGGVAPLSIDARDAEGQCQLEPAREDSSERLFEREWALTLLESVVAMVRREYETSGRGATFEVLKGVLEAGSSPISQSEMAALLGTSEAAIQVAVHRLRKRYREALLAAIAATVADEAVVDDELKALFAALGP
jgi:RNA polymerase sigma-70 factor (ECF subfamily)